MPRLLMAALLIGLFPAVAQGQTANPYAPESQSAPQVRVQFKAAQSTMLSSQMAGRLDELTVKDGERFTKGQVLAKINCSIPDAQLAKAKAALEKKNKVYAINAELLTLKSRGAMEVEVSKAEAAEAAADVRLYQAQQERCAVLAPYSGRVSEVLVREKQYVAEGQALMEILDDQSFELECIVPSRWLSWLSPGVPFGVVIDETGKTYQARVVRLGGKVDPVSQSVKVYAKIEGNYPELVQGMSGTAQFNPQP